MDIIVRRTRYVRAMNMIIADSENVYVGSVYNEEPDYFRLRARDDEGGFVVSSETVPENGSWRVISNDTVERLR